MRRHTLAALRSRWFPPAAHAFLFAVVWMDALAQGKPILDGPSRWGVIFLFFADFGGKFLGNLGRPPRLWHFVVGINRGRLVVLIGCVDSEPSWFIKIGIRSGTSLGCKRRTTRRPQRRADLKAEVAEHTDDIYGLFLASKCAGLPDLLERCLGDFGTGEALSVVVQLVQKQHTF